jgi:hypothetical protein
MASSLPASYLPLSLLGENARYAGTIITFGMPAPAAEFIISRNYFFARSVIHFLPSFLPSHQAH